MRHPPYSRVRTPSGGIPVQPYWWCPVYWWQARQRRRRQERPSCRLSIASGESAPERKRSGSATKRTFAQGNGTMRLDRAAVWPGSVSGTIQPRPQCWWAGLQPRDGRCGRAADPETCPGRRRTDAASTSRSNRLYPQPPTRYADTSPLTAQQRRGRRLEVSIEMGAMPLLPIPLSWRSASCDDCGEPVRHMAVGQNNVTLDPTPVSVLAERFSATGAVTAYEHRVGYQPHRCSLPQ